MNNQPALVWQPVSQDSYQVVGSLTMEQVPQLLSISLGALTRMGAIHVDLTRVDKVDSLGLVWLLTMIRQALKQHCRLEFSHIPAGLVSLAALSGLEPWFTTGPDNRAKSS